ncbi:RT/endonuclease [Hexamita inflata]|uniref:RT/endonuclease n=1 Tax=Hexamita inflata TaxID=28002 RepID=A0ABP1HYQ5_9EUKA
MIDLDPHQYAMQKQSMVKCVTKARKMHETKHLLKLDIQAAFSSINWEYLEYALKLAAVPLNIIQYIMSMLEPRYSRATGKLKCGSDISQIQQSRSSLKHMMLQHTVTIYYWVLIQINQMNQLQMPQMQNSVILGSPQNRLYIHNRLYISKMMTFCISQEIKTRNIQYFNSDFNIAYNSNPHIRTPIGELKKQ